MSGDAPRVTLRPALIADAEMVFSWRNDPFLVARSSSGRTVTWEEHRRWFESAVSGNQRKMFIVLVDGDPAGQVRFDPVDRGICAISAYLLKPYTARGLGVTAIRQGCDVIFKEWGVAEIRACVREDNPAGCSGFLKAGFKPTQQQGLCPAGHSTLVLLRGDPDRKA
ncbi:MAG: GNAT family N-acetyltransferase [Acidobacteriales bacterium]|nr:GNAT family N-acetyltransferase [Terriglobales bacterium]